MTERKSAPWLDSTNKGAELLEQKIVRRALLDVGIMEMPVGSNRSTRIDEYVRMVGSPVGSFWCAAAVAAWFRESGARIPGIEAGSCDRWMHWAKANGLWTLMPGIGYAVLFGNPADAQHIGIVARIKPVMASVEGNTSMGGYNRNGFAIDLKETARDRVIGYVRPVPV